MWAIIYPGTYLPSQSKVISNAKLVSALPLIIALFIAHRRANKTSGLADYKTPYQMLGFRRLSASLFWQLDVVGVILLIAVFALILVPLTIAGGVKTEWKTAHVVAPLVVGVLCIPVFILWEKKCRHPMVPFKVRTNLYPAFILLTISN